MQKIILNFDQSTNNVLDDSGAIVGCLMSNPVPVSDKGETTLALIKNGVTVDEIIKLKNSELI